MTSKNDDDVLEVLMEVRDAMAASGQGPDMPELHNFTGDRDNWYDPRRPLATDVWRVLAGLPLKYHGSAVPKEVEEHAAHGRKFFGGHPCLCEVCTAHRRKTEPRACLSCNGTGKILEDHDGRSGYRPCKECT
jgi:hypothetical protein